MNGRHGASLYKSGAPISRRRFLRGLGTAVAGLLAAGCLPIRSWMSTSMRVKEQEPTPGTSYDPEGNGSGLASLGVHEHWNNATDKQYSADEYIRRNLGTGKGIELVSCCNESGGT